MKNNYLKNLAKPISRKKKKNKYGNKRITVNGIHYPSEGEYKRECQLKIQQKAGVIKDLKRQVTFKLEVNGDLICRYVADWTYIIVETEVFAVEDYKGIVTPMFKLKKKLMKACHGIDIWVNKNINAHCLLNYQD